MKSSVKPKYHAENIDYEYTNPFFKSIWFKDFEGHSKEERLDIESASSLTFNENRCQWELVTLVADTANLKIDQHEGILIITGEKIVQQQKENFAKYFRIPENIDIDNIEATLSGDQLKIQLPLLQKKTGQMIAIK